MLLAGAGETKVGVFGHETSGEESEMQEPEKYETELYDKVLEEWQGVCVCVSVCVYEIVLNLIIHVFV